MKLQKLHIKNFKSIVDLEILEPNPFTVFVGPNGSGKSNIFEALELVHLLGNISEYEIENILGGKESYLNVNSLSERVSLSFDYEGKKYSYIFPEAQITTTINPLFTPTPSLTPTPVSVDTKTTKHESSKFEVPNTYSPSFANWIVLNFTNLRSSIPNVSNKKGKYKSAEKLDSFASNLEKVLKRILQDEIKREEILEILELLIPELETIQIYSDSISGQETLLIKEKHTNRHFGKSLISDGTYNILCLLTALYQSDEPQFLCIEEPENGLNPYAIELLVELMRNRCQEKGHYIWLNTHSPTLVRNLRADELIVVDKKQGATQIKQFKGKDFFGLRMDEAWLTNALGGGLPW